MVVRIEARSLRIGSRLEHVLEDGAFAVTAEIAPPAAADAGHVRATAALLRGSVDACNVTDCQRALVKMSALAASAVVAQEGVEPIMQMVLRDRNRIALQADLVGAYALGVRNVLCLRGDDPHVGKEKDAAAVFDLSTPEMIAMFRNLRDRGESWGGERIEPRPRVLIGAAANPFAGSPEESFANLRGKVEAGADFIQTQAIYDVEAFEDWMRLVRKEWLQDHVRILAGVIPLRSAKMARFLSEKVPGVVVPRDVLERMESAPDPKAEGFRIALRTIDALREIEGVRGVHIMAVNGEDIVPELARAAGLLPRPDAPDLT